MQRRLPVTVGQNGMAKRPGLPEQGPGSSKPSRPSREELQAAVGRTLPDVIAPGLNVLFVGINPGLYSAAVGRHFARPGNRFWPALHRSGFTPRLLGPEQEEELLPLGLGITNLVERATASAAELAPEEFRNGAQLLEEKVARFAPCWVAFVGIGAYATAFGRRRVQVELQSETIAGSRIWVLPNTSGLNAHYKPAEFAAAFSELRETAENSPNMSARHPGSILSVAPPPHSRLHISRGV